MRSGFTSYRARLAASVTAVLGLSFIGGCHGKRAADPAPNKAPEIAIPDPVATPAAPDSGVATTLAIGEEDGGYVQPSPGEPTVTTLAVGEEDGSGPIPVEPDGGIGDGAGPPTDIVTTEAIGEEDGGYEKIYIPDVPDAGIVSPAPSYEQVTTLAIGEEG